MSHRRRYHLTPSLVVGSESTPTLAEALEVLRDDGVDAEWLLVLEARGRNWELSEA